MIQYLIASKMVRKSWGLARRIINFDNRRSATAKEIANACRRNKNQTSNQIKSLKSNFSYHKARILMRKYMEMFWDRWELEDVQYFLLGVETDSINIKVNILGHLGQSCYINSVFLYKGENQVSSVLPGSVFKFDHVSSSING